MNKKSIFGSVFIFAICLILSVGCNLQNENDKGEKGSSLGNETPASDYKNELDGKIDEATEEVQKKVDDTKVFQDKTDEIKENFKKNVGSASSSDENDVFQGSDNSKQKETNVKQPWQQEDEDDEEQQIGDEEDTESIKDAEKETKKDGNLKDNSADEEEDEMLIDDDLDANDSTAINDSDDFEQDNY